MKRHTIAPFHHPLHVAVGDEWPALMRRLGLASTGAMDDDPRDRNDARTYYNPDVTPPRYGIWLHGLSTHDDISVPMIAGTIAHECVHVVDFLWERIGEGSTDEMHAYYVGHLTELVMADVLDYRHAQQETHE